MDANAPLIVLQCVAGNAPVTFSPIQQVLMAHVVFFQFAWWGVWVATAVYALSKLVWYKT